MWAVQIDGSQSGPQVLFSKSKKLPHSASLGQSHDCQLHQNSMRSSGSPHFAWILIESLSGRDRQSSGTGCTGPQMTLPSPICISSCTTVFSHSAQDCSTTSSQNPASDPEIAVKILVSSTDSNGGFLPIQTGQRDRTLSVRSPVCVGLAKVTWLLWRMWWSINTFLP